MKKLVALVLALMLFVPVAFAAPSYEDALPGYYKPPKMNEGQYPIEGENLKLTYWMPIDGGAAKFISSYEENLAYQYIQKETGVDIEFIQPAAGTQQENFQLLLGGDLPDMILMTNASWYNGGLQALYDDGVIIDLTPYLDEYAPQYKEISTYNEVGKAQTYIDGKALGIFKMTYADPSPYTRMNLNKDWMLEAGLESEPQTIAEYEQYFQWVLDNQPGVTPLAFNFTNPDVQSLNCFTGAFDFLADWYVTKEDPNKVAHWANTPAYKDWLTLMNSWYTKGYVTDDVLSQTGTEIEAMFDAGKIAAYVGSVDNAFTRTKDIDGHFVVTNAPYLTKEKGQILGSNLATKPVGGGGDWVTVVTTACKNPEVAVQYLNYCYTYEGSLFPNFGVEDITYTWTEENFPYYTDLMFKNPQGMTTSDTAYAIRIHFGAKYCYPDAITSAGQMSNPTARAIRNMWKDLGTEQNWLQLPPINLNAEEQAARNDNMIQVDTYAREMMVKFITGAEPLDKFDEYVKSVEEYGLLEAIEITQGALDRFFGR